ncbi:alpha/beta hydrolase [Leptothermofonsia sichuanensis E412]|nr:alpha/beta hydrolase [Leptothermofonsia sichuanensis E412]
MPMDTIAASAPAPAITQFELYPIQTPQSKESASNSPSVLGYFVKSTAPINVDEESSLKPLSEDKGTAIEIQAIARYLVAAKNPEIITSIHGYGTQRSDAEARYQKIYDYAQTICSPDTTVFLGYLWPSEKPTGDPSIPGNTFQDKRKQAFQALPIFPSKIFRLALLLVLVAAPLMIVTASHNGLLGNGLLTLVVVGSSIAFATLLSLILLRLSAYFRDNYRATNFGVPDLVELFRQIDQAVIEADKTGEFNPGCGNPCKRKVKLTFIGHSMGGFVVTNAIRILSDVFDQLSIEKRPPSNIGRIFCLSRLILVAPDIPVEAIIPRRANFLRSALRRCEEAYVFTNEADLALRLASTAANYISFPSKKRSSGYRLGNVTVARFSGAGDRRKSQLKDENYGIVNREHETFGSPYHYLEIRASGEEHQKLSEIRAFQQIEKENTDDLKNAPISDLFTYFDCTDYIDYQGSLMQPQHQGEPRGVVSYATRKPALDLWDYIKVGFAYFFGGERSINVHGGFFDGIFSQKLIYNLAFMGFQKTIKSLSGQEDFKDTPFDELPLDAKHTLLDQWSEQCREKGIQVVLAPVRYRKDILGQ